MKSNGVVAVAAAGAVAAIPEALATFALVTGTFGAAIKDSLIKDYATAQAALTTQVVTWETSVKTCDLTKWTAATDCNSVDLPWASGSYTEFVAAAGAAAAVDGSIRTWHFLAEKNADVTKNFQIEKDNKINWVI